MMIVVFHDIIMYRDKLKRNKTAGEAIMEGGYCHVGSERNYKRKYGCCRRR